MRKAIKPFVREFKNRSTKPAFLLSGPLLESPDPAETRVADNITALETIASPVEERRILPSLIETVPDPLTLRLHEAKEKRKRVGRKAKSKEIDAVVMSAPLREQSVLERPQRHAVHIPHREPSAIQMRWVLKINKPGENWKQRRLHRPLDR